MKHVKKTRLNLSKDTIRLLASSQLRDLRGAAVQNNDTLIGCYTENQCGPQTQPPYQCGTGLPCPITTLQETICYGVCA